MRFINLYLIGYFILLIGAAGCPLVRRRAPPRVTGCGSSIGLVIAVGLGIMLSVSGGKPEITRRIARPASRAAHRSTSDLARDVVTSSSRAFVARLHAVSLRRSPSFWPLLRRRGRLHRGAADAIRVDAPEVHRRQGGQAGPAEVGAGHRRRARSCPGATKHYFTREQFDADLKRIVAFYRGPRVSRREGDARSTSS